MRVAGRLAAQVLDMIAPHVQPGIATEELDRLCHEYIVGELDSIPAPLNYRGSAGAAPFPKSICTSVNHVVCHGIPSDRTLRNGDIVNIDVTVIKDGYHGDTSRMFMVGAPSIMARAAHAGVLRRDVARHPRDAPGRPARRHRPRDPELRRGAALLRRARVLRARHRPRVPRGPAGAALRPARHRRRARARNDDHRRADGQRRQARGEAPVRRLDRRHEGPLSVRAVGAHGARHGHGLRGPDLEPGRRAARDAIDESRAQRPLRSSTAARSSRRCAATSGPSRRSATR